MKKKWKKKWKILLTTIIVIAVGIHVIWGIWCLRTWCLRTRSVPQIVKETVIVTPTATVTPTMTPKATITPTAMASLTVTPTVAVTGTLASAVDYGQPPQLQVRHPSLYKETGIGGTQTWALEIDEDKVLIVGGWKVDDVSGGVYRAVSGPTAVTLKVTDGFVAIVKAEWAQTEFCFRVAQAREYGWAHQNIQPLEGWTCN